MNLSIGARNAMLAPLRTALNGGFLYIYSGTMPANAEDAISSGTLLCKITESDDGTTGLTFNAAANGAITKTVAEDWTAIITASGTAAFFRFCDSTDTPATASGSKQRLQGACGVAGSGAELILETVVLVANASNKTGAADFVVNQN